MTEDCISKTSEGAVGEGARGGKEGGRQGHCGGNIWALDAVVRESVPHSKVFTEPLT